MIGLVSLIYVLYISDMGTKKASTYSCCLNTTITSTLYFTFFHNSDYINPTSTTITTINKHDESSTDLALALSLGISSGLMIIIVIVYFIKMNRGRNYGDKFYKNNAYDLKESEYAYETPVEYNTEYQNTNKIVYNDSNKYSEAE